MAIEQPSNNVIYKQGQTASAAPAKEDDRHNITTPPPVTIRPPIIGQALVQGLLTANLHDGHLRSFYEAYHSAGPKTEHRDFTGAEEYSLDFPVALVGMTESGRPFSVGVINLSFSSFNDNYGKALGNEILKKYVEAAKATEGVKEVYRKGVNLVIELKEGADPRTTLEAARQNIKQQRYWVSVLPGTIPETANNGSESPRSEFLKWVESNNIPGDEAGRYTIDAGAAPRWNDKAKAYTTGLDINIGELRSPKGNITQVDILRGVDETVAQANFNASRTGEYVDLNASDLPPYTQEKSVDRLLADSNRLLDPQTGFMRYPMLKEAIEASISTGTKFTIVAMDLNGLSGYGYTYGAMGSTLADITVNDAAKIIGEVCAEYGVQPYRGSSHSDEIYIPAFESKETMEEMLKKVEFKLSELTHFVPMRAEDLPEKGGQIFEEYLNENPGQGSAEKNGHKYVVVDIHDLKRYCAKGEQGIPIKRTPFAAGIMEVEPRGKGSTMTAYDVLDQTARISDAGKEARNITSITTYQPLMTEGEMQLAAEAMADVEKVITVFKSSLQQEGPAKAEEAGGPGYRPEQIPLPRPVTELPEMIYNGVSVRYGKAAADLLKEGVAPLTPEKLAGISTTLRDGILRMSPDQISASTGLTQENAKSLLDAANKSLKMQTAGGFISIASGIAGMEAVNLLIENTVPDLNPAIRTAAVFFAGHEINTAGTALVKSIAQGKLINPLDLKGGIKALNPFSMGPGLAASGAWNLAMDGIGVSRDSKLRNYGSFSAFMAPDAYKLSARYLFEKFGWRMLPGAGTKLASAGTGLAAFAAVNFAFGIYGAGAQSAMLDAYTRTVVERASKRFTDGMTGWQAPFRIPKMVVDAFGAKSYTDPFYAQEYQMEEVLREDRGHAEKLETMLKTQFGTAFIATMGEAMKTSDPAAISDAEIAKESTIKVISAIASNKESVRLFKEWQSFLKLYSSANAVDIPKELIELNIDDPSGFEPSDRFAKWVLRTSVVPTKDGKTVAIAEILNRTKTRNA